MTPGHNHVNRLREETFRVLEPRFEAIEKEVRSLYSMLLQTFGQIEQSLREARDVDFTPAVSVLTDAFQDEIRRQEESLSSVERFVSGMRSLETQEEILGFLLDSAHRHAPRLALFATRGEQVRGWSSRGYDEETAAGIKSYTSSTGNPLFARVMSSHGRMELEGLADAPGLAELLSPGAKGPWYFFPMTTLSRSVAVLAAAGSNEADPQVEMLSLMMVFAGMRIENLALRILREMEVPSAPGESARAPAPPEKPELPPEPRVEVPTPVEEAPGTTPEEPVEPAVEAVPLAETPWVSPESPHAEVQPADDSSLQRLAAETPEVETTVPEVAEPEEVPAPEEPPAEPSVAAESGPVEVHAPPAEAPEESKTQPQLAPVDEAQRFVEEERLHSDAKRFARLLVSEIKLYNEQRVLEGRENRDIYVRLKRDIDRSREMYQKRVSPTVSRKLDYFHDELVRILGDNDPSNLGSDYPGPMVES
jgi:hypothetical protein